jgi:hypothetical protein
MLKRTTVRNSAERRTLPLASPRASHQLTPTILPSSPSDETRVSLTIPPQMRIEVKHAVTVASSEWVAARSSPILHWG